jgi:hypothetical protein
MTKALTYVIDLRHYLNAKGAIAPAKGPARQMAEFVTGVVSAASDLLEEIPSPQCFRCGKATVQSGIAQDGAAFWFCPNCNIEGRISFWEGSFWDHTEGPDVDDEVSLY